MRLGRVLPFCLLLLVSAPTYAQETQTVPVESVSETAPVEAHEEGGGTMPQLDPTYYASQLFWLLVAGGLMFALMSKVALPRVAAILELRDAQVRKDLEKAAKLKLEAEEIKLSYLRALRDADERARALTERTLNEAREKQNTAINDVTVRSQKQIAETEQSLKLQKELVLTEISAISKDLSETIIDQLGKKAA